MKTKVLLFCMLSAFAALAGTAAVNDMAVVYGVIIFILVILIGGVYVIKFVKNKLRRGTQEVDIINSEEKV